MANLDAKFSGQIFRKDNPIILAVRRDQAVIMGVRVAYDSGGYMPGQVLVRKVSDGLFYKWSSASGATHDSTCVLFDQATDSDQLANNHGVLTGVSGSTLLRALMKAVVYTDNLIDYDSGAKGELGAVNFVDSGSVNLTKF
jgi:hypothetical protein